MAQSTIRFTDGTTYEQTMGVWSRLAGEVFLDWLEPTPGQRWLDVGCGSGAFTELIVQRCAPAEVQGIDPSEGQLGFARTRPAAQVARFQQGDAMALPFADDSFDAAVMALVIFFVPEPAKGVAEMARVIRPGGMIAAYAWDILGGGFPFAPVQAELRDLGIPPPLPPSVDASRIAALHGLWADAGLQEIETRDITVQRSFDSFEQFWAITSKATSVAPALAAMGPEQVDALQARLRARLPGDAAGRIAYSARANAVKGRLPA